MTAAAVAEVGEGATAAASFFGRATGDRDLDLEPSSSLPLSLEEPLLLELPLLSSFRLRFFESFFLSFLSFFFVFFFLLCREGERERWRLCLCLCFLLFFFSSSFFVVLFFLFFFSFLSSSSFLCRRFSPSSSSPPPRSPAPPSRQIAAEARALSKPCEDIASRCPRDVQGLLKALEQSNKAKEGKTDREF